MEIYFAAAAAVVALLLALVLLKSIGKVQIKNARVEEIMGFIRTGAMAFLKREYTVIAIFAGIMAVILLVLMGWQTAACFILGAALSVLAGVIGMNSATKANGRTAEAAQQKGERGALKVAFSGGSVMGMCVVGLGLLGVAIVCVVFKDFSLLAGFSFGASSVALFARVGGGIYTKAADVGADLVGKVENRIPEDDPRNPAVIADNVGDNVGDVAGMGADLFESYVGSIVSALLLGFAALKEQGVSYVMLLCGAGVLAAIIGVLLVRGLKKGDVQKSLMASMYISMGILIVAAAAADYLMFGAFFHFGAVACGVAVGVAIGMITEWYTSGDFKHVKAIAEQSKTGAATNILKGFSIGLRSSALPVLLIAAAIVGSFLLAGMFGIALAAVGMLACVGTVIAVDAYGPIADNAGGIAEMSKLPKEVRKITDKLDSIGNTTAAIGKGFSIGSAALTALALFSTYAASVNLDVINILDPMVIAGVFVGGMLCFLFAALTIDAVSKSASSMIDEVRRQFKEIPGLLAGTGKPDYAKCVDISTKSALAQMIVPGVIAIAAPILVGLLLGKAALAGLLMGATVVGVLLAIMMSNAGGAWDNAKKYIEGQPDGKGSEPHSAAVIGDTVGDPFKDTAGPSMNILIKLMSIVAMVFVPLFIN